MNHEKSSDDNFPLSNSKSPKGQLTFKTTNGAYSLSSDLPGLAVINNKAFIAIDTLFDNRSVPSYVLQDLGINSYIRIDDFGIDDFSTTDIYGSNQFIN